MISKEQMEKIDSEKMFRIYDNWPKIARESFYTKIEPFDFGKINHIIFAGMGGSGTLGDFFAAILSKTNLHVNVVKGYLLPKTVDKNSLVVVTSVSGNTEETLSILESAKKIGCKIIGFSSGGKMEEYCKENDILFKKIRKYHSPRASFVSFLYSMLYILSPSIPIKKNEIENSIRELEITKENISSDNLNLANESLNLATEISGIPLIYYPWGLQAAAIRFKSALQENAKTHSAVEDIVEASHNGIVAWEKESNIEPILLQGEDDYIKTKERWKIFEEFFHEREIKFQKIVSRKGDIISKLVNLIYVLDYASIYLAIIKNVDPTPVQSISYVKKRLEKI